MWTKKSSTIALYSTTRLLSYHQTGSTTTGREKKNAPLVWRPFTLSFSVRIVDPPPTCYRTGIVQQSRQQELSCTTVQLSFSSYWTAPVPVVQDVESPQWRINQARWMGGHGCRSSSVKAKCRHCPRHCAEKWNTTATTTASSPLVLSSSSSSSSVIVIDRFTCSLFLSGTLMFSYAANHCRCCCSFTT